MIQLAKQLRQVAERNRCLPWRGLGKMAERTMSGRNCPLPIAGRGSSDSTRVAQRLARLEGVLWLAREPLTTRKLANFASLADGTEARTLLRQLAERYDRRGCAFQVVRLAGGHQLLTRRQFAPWLKIHAPRQDALELSDPAMETLAVVAYRQPVLRADVEAIRGVVCGELLRQLMDRDLLRIVGRSEELGRPFLYGTTKRFLQVFGLKNLEELPRAAQLRPHTTAAEAA